MEERVPQTRKEFTRGEAVRTLAFWVFSLGIATHSFLITAVTFHITSLANEVEVSRMAAYRLFLPMSVFGIFGTFFGGWISDRIRLKWLLFGMMATQAIGTTGLLNFGTTPGKIMFFAGYGISGGLFATLNTVTYPRFFGRLHLGAVSGLSMSILVFASAIGPVLFSVVEKFAGSYKPIIIACLLMPIIVIITALRAHNPQDSIM